MNGKLLAIDPGKSGGIALFNDGDIVDCLGWDNSCDIIQFVKHAVGHSFDTRAIIEQVQGHIGKRRTGKTMFTFGENFGWWKGLLQGLSIPFDTVRPQVWQKGLPGLAKLEDLPRKKRLWEIANERYPLAHCTMRTADAVLIGDWYLKQNQGENKHE